MKNAVFLREHVVIYKNNLSNDISDYQQTNYRLRSIVKEFSPGHKECVVEIPMCWSGILLKYVKKMVDVDDCIVFHSIKSEHGGLKIKADVATYKFSQMRTMVKAATKEIYSLVQDRLIKEFVQEETN